MAPLYQALLPDGSTCPTDSSAAARRHWAIQKILQEPLAYPPGLQTLYSDLGFILLADIVETRYEQPLDRLFRERVAQPLGLHCTGYRPLDGPSSLPASPTAYAATEACPWRARVLAGEVHDENAWAMGGVAGHAGLFATAEDLWHFAHALLETAAGRRDWLPPALLRESWQRHATPPGTTRALGWDTPTPGRSSSGDYFSEQSIGHLGFTGCSLWIDLAQQVTVILCTNRVHPSRQATWYYQPATGSAQPDYARFRSGNDVTAVQPQHIHLIAACGTGMGSLAGMLKARGYHVTGSDQHVYPPMSTQLQAWGIPLYNGFSAEHLVPRPDLVIVGNAVSRDNPEAMATEQAGHSRDVVSAGFSTFLYSRAALGGGHRHARQEYDDRAYRLVAPACWL